MVSVIVPIYNVEKFLPKCIESLQAQTLSDIEIILVDDGSPDGCPEICDKYAANDPRVSVIHQRNSGVSAARNAGLKMAVGEYISFCDPDDFVAPDMYAELLSGIEKHDADISVCGYNYCSEDYVLDDTRLYNQREDEVLSRRDLYSKLSDMPPTIRHGVVTKLFKKKLIGNLKFDTNLKSAEDGDFLLKYLKNVKNGVFIHKPLYFNLVRQGSATHGGLNIESLKDSFSVHNRMYEDSIAVDDTLRNKALAFLMDVCTLKYDDAKSRADKSPESVQYLKQMHQFLRRKALSAIWNSSIYWKTRIYYLLLWIRK